MAMDKSAASSYIYAKACALISKSFIGENSSKLFQAKSLQELWSLLFSDEIPAIPEKLLAKEIEACAQSKFISDFLKLVSYYSDPEPVLITLLQDFEYTNLKHVASALCFGQKECPDLVDVHQYSIFKWECWPDLNHIVDVPGFENLKKVPPVKELAAYENCLDKKYIFNVLSAIKKIGGECEAALRDLFIEKFQIENIVWALRLKWIYKFKDEKIIDFLVFDKNSKNTSDLIGGDALKILTFSEDDLAEFSKSKIKKFLNPKDENGLWKVDAEYIFNAYKAQEWKKAKRLFHEHIETCCPLVCWYLLKQNELDNIRRACETLRLGSLEE